MLVLSSATSAPTAAAIGDQQALGEPQVRDQLELLVVPLVAPT